MKRINWTSLLFFSVVVLGATAAFAGGGEGGGDHHAHIANWWTPTGEKNAHAPAFGWVVATWLIFIGIVVKAAAKPLKAVLVGRHETVKNAIEAAAKAKAEAEAKKAEYERRLASLDDELAEMREDFEARGKAERARLVEQAEKMAERIEKDAEDTINAEVERATETLRTEAGKLALELATAKVEKAISADDHQRLETAFLSELNAERPQA